MQKTLRRLAAVAAGTAVAVGSASAAVQGVARIEISLAPGASSYLQVAEVVAMSGGADVAVAGTATASATSLYFMRSTTASAIDGNTGGSFWGDVIYHSGVGDANPVLTIDFGGAAFDLDSLAIFGRTDCCTGRDVYDVTLFGLDGAVLFSQSGLAANGAGVEADLPVTAVPLPGAMALFVPALGGLFAARRKA